MTKKAGLDALFAAMRQDLLLVLVG
jgi:hypothetical protein